MLRAFSAAVLIVGTMTAATQAQEPYPTRPISIVVGAPPGGLADNTARPMATALQKILRQRVVVINTAEVASAVANVAGVRNNPDGYTLLMVPGSISVLPEVDKLFGRPTRYALDQFTGIARISGDHFMLAVRADQQWKTIKDLVADARKRPGEIVFSSSGVYGSPHISMEMFMLASGIRLRHLPKTDDGAMMNAILGGKAQAVMTPLSLAAEHVRSGKLRLLAYTGTEPVVTYRWGSRITGGGRPIFQTSDSAEVPSFKSLGYDIEYVAWAGLVVPAKTPPHIIKKLRDAVQEAVKEPEVINSRAKLETPITHTYMDAPEFNRWWVKDAARLAEVVRSIGKVEGEQ